MSVPSTLLSVSGSPITASGTFTVSLPVRAANLVFAGPDTGADAAPTFRALVATDIPSLDASKITTGILPIARGGTNLSALGSPLQELRVNAGGTALEYFTPSSGGIGGSTGATDNAILRADGTGGSTVQSSLVNIDDSGNVVLPASTYLRLSGDNGKIYFSNTNDYGIKRESGFIHLWVNTGIESYGHLWSSSQYSIRAAAPTIEFQPNASAATSFIQTLTDVGFNTTCGITVRTGEMSGVSQARGSGSLSFITGDCASNNASAFVGSITINPGTLTNAGSAVNAAAMTVSGGNTAGSGLGGPLNLYEGTSGSGSVGLITIGRTASVSRLRINSTVDATAGSIVEYLTVNINGTDRKIAVYAV
jgi:hypothetical protein